MEGGQDQGVVAQRNDARSWQVRSYVAGDERKVAQLYAAVYGRPLQVEQYHWKLVEVPWSLPAPNVWVADAGVQLAGHYAATPLRFKLGNDELTIGHTGDAMTHPEFRRQGVFTTVASAAHGAWAAAGVPFMVGVPNDKWLSRRAPLGYREQFKLVWLWRPLRPDLSLTRRWRLPGPVQKLAQVGGRLWHAFWDLAIRGTGEVTVSDVSRPGPAFDTLWQNLKDEWAALYVRDRAWLTYRYADAPGFGYRMLLARRGEQPAGFIVYRVTGEGARTSGWIVDFFTAARDREAQHALLKSALMGMYAAGADTARILLSPQAILAKTMRRAGFWRARGEFDASLVFLKQPLPDLSSPATWFTTAGDYDII